VLARFFIDRPVLAWVISLVIVLLGGISAALLPTAEYPEITPPTVQVTARYPGADAKVVADTVAAPIEQQVNGVERMLYMSSKCTNDGQMNLDVTFELGTNLDTAQVLVQNRVAVAEAKLPEDVKRIGVTTKKKSPSILMCVNIVSTKKPALETPQELSARIDEAARVVDRDRLGLSTQCGFASIAAGNPITEADEESKLRLVADTAHAAWG